MKKITFILLLTGFVFKTDVYSQTWSALGSGTDGNVQALTIYNNELIAGGEFTTAGGMGTYYIAKWYSPFGVKSIGGKIPKSFSLFQNYPNPFNPATKIKFDIPKSGNVKLIVYDVLGREVATLVNENLKLGKYEIEWNALNMPSGVYFYRIIVGDFSETKRMVLVK